jgi:Cu/Ag efflux pump CusA
VMFGLRLQEVCRDQGREKARDDERAEDRHRDGDNMGKRPYRAALDASDEIGLAVVATTMAIVVVFLPISPSS